MTNIQLVYEKRTQLKEGWFVVHGDEPFLEKVLWGKVSFGEHRHVFVIKRDGAECIYRDYEKGIIFESEREGREASIKTKDFGERHG